LYTANTQYSLTKSGKLLNKVFVCLQEYADTFGVFVQKDTDELLKLCKIYHIIGIIQIILISLFFGGIIFDFFVVIY